MDIDITVDTLSVVTTPTNPIKVFYCYAHEDCRFRDELEKHLGNLKRWYLITSWYDGAIGAGEEWEKKIDEQIRTANIIFLLISPDFISSDYCYGVEMKRALERHETGEARVIPILLRPTDWEDAPFSRLQMLPTGKLAEGWDGNTGLRPPCPNIQPKKIGPKVRHNFHWPSLFQATKCIW